MIQTGQYYKGTIPLKLIKLKLLMYIIGKYWLTGDAG